MSGARALGESAITKQSAERLYTTPPTPSSGKGFGINLATGTVRRHREIPWRVAVGLVQSALSVPPRGRAAVRNRWLAVIEAGSRRPARRVPSSSGRSRAQANVIGNERLMNQYEWCP